MSLVGGEGILGERIGKNKKIIFTLPENRYKEALHLQKTYSKWQEVSYLRKS
jgi:hypothetical protein